MSLKLLPVYFSVCLSLASVTMAQSGAPVSPQQTAPATPQQASPASPQPAATPVSSPEKLQSKLDELSAWMGEWRCEGTFAKRRMKITSTISFAPVLKGRWIEMRQDDVKPDRFHALEMWGFDDKQSLFTATLYDNFNPVPRQFTADGIHDGKLTLTRTVTGGSPMHTEQFVFEYGNDKLTVTYQAMIARESSARIGDVLNCTRQ